MDKNTTLFSLLARFRYTSDQFRWLDDWRIMKRDDHGLFKGDCEDFALTLLWELANQSMWRFWWLQITFQAVMWQVTTASGNGHAVLWYRGAWADCTQPNWYPTEKMPHTRRFPWLWPLVMLKFAMTLLPRFAKKFA